MGAGASATPSLMDAVVLRMKWQAACTCNYHNEPILDPAKNLAGESQAATSHRVANKQT